MTREEVETPPSVRRSTRIKENQSSVKEPSSTSQHSNVTPRKRRRLFDSATPSRDEASLNTSSNPEAEESSFIPSPNVTGRSSLGPVIAGQNLHNQLYVALRNESVAVESVAVEWLEKFEHRIDPAVVDLATLILQASGCSGVVPSNTFVHDSIVEVLDELQSNYQNEMTADYPFINRSKNMKRFKNNVLEFFDKLFLQIQHTLLLEDEFITFFKSWVVAMSSSHYRPFRHTSTTISLKITTSLVKIIQNINKEIRTSEIQMSKGKRGRGSRNHNGDIELAKKTEELRSCKDKLTAHLVDLFDGVFIHRYRDLDPHIRTECVKELGNWVMEYPEYFLDGNYLRYIGWMLSDKNPQTRLEAVNSILRLITKETHLTGLKSFLERFNQRILEIATGDIDDSIAITTLSLINEMDKHDFLEEEDRKNIILQIFHPSPKIRRATAPFVARHYTADYLEVLNIELQELEGDLSKKDFKIMEKFLELKSFINILTELTDLIHSSRQSCSSGSHKEAMVPNESGPEVWFIMEALWSELPMLHDYKAMVSFLQWEAKESLPRIEKMLKLDEKEETLLLAILVTSIKKLLLIPLDYHGQKDSVTPFSNKKSTIDFKELKKEITDFLVEELPSLYIRHLTSDDKIRELAELPRIIDPNVFFDMGLISAFELILDDLIKVVSTYKNVDVIVACIRTLHMFRKHDSVSDLTKSKLSQLETHLINDELECFENVNQNIDEESVSRLLYSLTRIQAYLVMFDITPNKNSEGQCTVSSFLASTTDTVDMFIKTPSNLGPTERMIMESIVEISLRLLLWTANTTFKTVEVENQNPKEDSLNQLKDMKDQTVHLCEKILSFAPDSDSFNADFGLPSLQQKAFGIISDVCSLVVGDIGLKYLIQEKELSAILSPTIQSGSLALVQYLLELAVKKRTEDMGMNSISTIVTYIKLVLNGLLPISSITNILQHFGVGIPSLDSACKLAVESIIKDVCDSEKSDLTSSKLRKSNSKIMELVLEAFQSCLQKIYEDHGEERALNLSRSFTNWLRSFKCFGMHVSFNKYILEPCVVDTQVSCISWLFEKLQKDEDDEKEEDDAEKAQRIRSWIPFFKPLNFFTTFLSEKGADKVMKHIKNTMAAANMSQYMHLLTKDWEPFQTYFRQLRKATEKSSTKPKKKTETTSPMVSQVEQEVAHEEGPLALSTPSAKPIRTVQMSQSTPMTKLQKAKESNPSDSVPSFEFSPIQYTTRDDESRMRPHLEKTPELEAIPSPSLSSVGELSEEKSDASTPNSMGLKRNTKDNSPLTTRPKRLRMT